MMSTKIVGPRAIVVLMALVAATLVYADAQTDGRGTAWADQTPAFSALGETSEAVRSTLAQLEAVQDGWDLRLRELLPRGGYSTALVAGRNAVKVNLAASLSSAVRAKVEHEAADAAVDVSVAIVPEESLAYVPWGGCATFVPWKAYCDPTIVSGQSIDDEEDSKGLGDCSAGPPLINVKRDTKEAATETFLLTAGHCLVGEGVVGKKWFAIEKAAARKEIGKATDRLMVELKIGVDAGLIKMEKEPWAKAKDPSPVVPTIARWDATKATDPFPIIQESPIAVDDKTCFSVQRSGLLCGKVIEEKATIPVKDDKGNVIGEAKEIAKLQIDGGVKAGVGDSGGPAFKKEQYEKGEGYVQGIIVAGPAPESNIAYIQPLKFILDGLKAQKGRDLELLTQAKEKRHGKVKGGQYPVTIHGATTGVEEFSTEIGALKCEKSSYHAVLLEPSSTLTVTPKYEACTAMGTPATIETAGCAYVYHVAEKVSTDNYRAYMDVSCSGGQSIKVTTGSGQCKFEVKPQNELETVDLIDDTGASPKRDITARPTIEGIAYTVTLDGFLCPFNGTGEKKGGKYTNTSNITLTGQNTSSPSEKVDIEVSDQ